MMIRENGEVILDIGLDTVNYRGKEYTITNEWLTPNADVFTTAISEDDRTAISVVNGERILEFDRVPTRAYANIVLWNEEDADGSSKKRTEFKSLNGLPGDTQVKYAIYRFAPKSPEHRAALERYKERLIQRMPEERESTANGEYREDIQRQIIIVDDIMKYGRPLMHDDFHCLSMRSFECSESLDNIRAEFDCVVMGKDERIIYDSNGSFPPVLGELLSESGILNHLTNTQRGLLERVCSDAVEFRCYIDMIEAIDDPEKLEEVQKIFLNSLEAEAKLNVTETGMSTTHINQVFVMLKEKAWQYETEIFKTPNFTAKQAGEIREGFRDGLRYTVVETSDAFADPYAIYDNKLGDYYYDDKGWMPTFESFEKALAAEQEVNLKETEKQKSKMAKKKREEAER